MKKNTGAHAIIRSTNPDADRALLRDVAKLKHVHARDGWLIFAMPPNGVAGHPAEEHDVNELYLVTGDIDGFVVEMRRRKVTCSTVEHKDWGRLAHVTLPGGGKLGVYQPRHARPPA